MQRDQLTIDLEKAAFDFFFWFSRFEFALKEKQFLRDHRANAKAEPGWDSFVRAHEATYIASPQANALVAAKPHQQVVGASSTLTWAPVNVADCQSDLCRVVRHLKAVRNNLFHGGKHSGPGWDDPQRTHLLLTHGKTILDQLATSSGIEPEYRCLY